MQMEMLTAALCDSAADYNGKLCILGAFDTIWAQRFPAVHPQCSVALRLLVKDTDQGMHTLSVAFIDPDGKNMLPQSGPTIQFEVGEIPNDTFFLSRNFVFNFQGLPLPKPGQNSIDV